MENPYTKGNMRLPITVFVINMYNAVLCPDMTSLAEAEMRQVTFTHRESSLKTLCVMNGQHGTAAESFMLLIAPQILPDA